MVDLGGYPAAFRAVKGEIQGELVRFRKLEEVLRRVDRLEGFSGYHSDSLYHRAIIQVDAGVERSLDAWVYLLAGSWRDYPVIGSADWRVYRGEVNGADNTNVVR
jgi:gamma-glutamylcyclotransferase (GGCT)/AIG2-like uncharacterized protein YtfP